MHMRVMKFYFHSIIKTVSKEILLITMQKKTLKGKNILIMHSYIHDKN